MLLGGGEPGVGALRLHDWTGPIVESQGADAWLAAAEQHDGSWWDDWHAWQRRRAGGKKVPARVPGDGALRPIEDAPGAYVLAS